MTPTTLSDPPGNMARTKKKARVEEVVHLAVPQVDKHTHRKLRILSIRNEVTLKDLVVDLIQTHPRVVEVEDEFVAKPKRRGGS